MTASLEGVTEKIMPRPGKPSRRFLAAMVVLLLLLGAAILAAALLGSERLPPFDAICAMFSGNICGLTAEQSAILFDIRLPRVFLGVSVGAALAVAGASYQSLLRNPLAEPYLLGVSNGAAIGTMFALVFFSTFAFSRPLLAFGGAMLSTMAVYSIARSRAGMNVERLALAGVIVTTFLSSAIVLITTLLDATKLRTFTFWLLGDLSAASKDSLYVALPTVIVGTILLAMLARALNLLQLGERDAFDFGVEVKQTRFLVFLVAGALVGTSVAASGSVGYVGLVVPHLVRLSLGSDNRLVLPASAIAGAIFVTLADTVARTVIAPRELPVGAITALIGAPLFIYLLKKQSA
ncbi:MAG TPA: iron ABC transporter permease [Pyrinomonadaceae bacterium]|nr:iron ABC transporter permease [Pyrinomonadaceae bacterium]